MSISRKDWFPTPIWHFTIDNYQALNSVLLEEIDREQQKNPRGINSSNILGWHSSNNLHKLDRFAEFRQIINKNVLEVSTALEWDLQKFSLDITGCWAMVNGKYASSALHNHPNSILSGVYYLKTPENCGGICFSDPRPASQVLMPPVVKYNLWTLPKISYKAHEGSMLLFPSWLLHGIETNMSDELRVSISFNIGMINLSSVS